MSRWLKGFMTDPMTQLRTRRVFSSEAGLRGYVVRIVIIVIVVVTGQKQSPTLHVQYFGRFFHNFFSDLLSLYYNKDIFKFCLFCKCFKGNIYTQSVHSFPVYIETTHMHTKYRHKLVLFSV